MQYFVSAEKNSYFYWQLELLIESFKKYNLEDSLVIALADSEGGGKIIPRNISKTNHFVHKNWGDDLNYKYINKFLSIDMARKLGLVKPPFTVIEPDMILLKPLKFSYSEDIDAIFSRFEDNNFENYVELNNNVFFKQDKWKPTGSIVCLIRDCPTMYLGMANDCKNLIEKASSNNSIEKYWRLIDKISWNLGLLRNHLVFNVDDELECDLLKNANANFMHYRNPYEFFSKFEHKTEQKDILDLSAYNKMLTINPNYSNNIKYLQETIKKLLEEEK